MVMTKLEGSPNILVEQCCEGASVIRTFEEWGVQWPDGVRHWNRGNTTHCACSKCGRTLKWQLDSARLSGGKESNG